MATQTGKSEITMILILTFGLLFLSFAIHVLWWRVRMPARTTNALLLVFFCMPFIVVYGFHLQAAYTHTDMIRMGLLYTSCSLVYIILYSAIEQQSPTLRIIHFINHQGKSGCNNQSLISHLQANDEIKKRLELMEQGGWITPVQNRWQLTKKGWRIAFLFENTAAIFGIKSGG